MNKVYKVKVKRSHDVDWTDWTGNFSEKNGESIESIEKFINDNFSTKQFDSYMFGIFIRSHKDNNNHYIFDFVKEIDIIRDSRDIDLS